MTSADPLHAGLVARLKAAIGPGQVVTDPDELAGLARDQLRARRAFRPPAGVPAPPLAAVRPRCAEDVIAVVRLAAETKTPVVEHGGGTGLMGGALAVRPGIVLDMRSMNRVLAVSSEDRTATVEAGIVLADLNKALSPHGLILGHDPWTVPIATVGGTISTNSLGYRGAKYGSMGDQVLGLEAVLADGTMLRTRAVPRSSTGPRLHHLFVGAEGIFGVITAATLRVFPAPERRELLGLDFPSFAHGFEAVRAMFAIGLTPALIDYGGPPGGTARMYLGFEGVTEEVVAVLGRARAIVTAHQATELPAAAAQTFWSERHVSAERLRVWRRAEREEPLPGEPGSEVFDYLHVSLPASWVLPYIERAGAIFARHGVTVREWGLWNQPELLSAVIARRTDTPADLAEIVTAMDEALMLVQDLGGSMEYVHGAGIRYAHLMAREHGASLDALRAIKRALDPDSILNPGKLGL
jgi:FAD/FMN-containing dehydrogenase